MNLHPMVPVLVLLLAAAGAMWLAVVAARKAASSEVPDGKKSGYAVLVGVSLFGGLLMSVPFAYLLFKALRVMTCYWLDVEMYLERTALLTGAKAPGTAGIMDWLTEVPAWLMLVVILLAWPRAKKLLAVAIKVVGKLSKVIDKLLKDDDEEEKVAK